MLKKEVCQKCYRFNERVWGEYEDGEWDKEGMVFCPKDYFNNIRYKGKSMNIEGGMRNLFSAIYGWNEIDDEVPKFCKFSEEHLKSGE